MIHNNNGNLQVDASNIGQLDHLDVALEAAPASVSMPYMHHEVGRAPILARRRHEIRHLRRCLALLELPCCSAADSHA